MTDEIPNSEKTGAFSKILTSPVKIFTRGLALITSIFASLTQEKEILAGPQTKGYNRWTRLTKWIKTRLPDISHSVKQLYWHAENKIPLK